MMATVRGATRVRIGGPLVRSGRRIPRGAIALLSLSGLFFGVNFVQEWLMSHQVQQKAAQLQATIEQTDRLNAQLRQQLGYYQSKQYIIPAARALGLGRPGDTLIVVKQQPPRVKIVPVQTQDSPGQGTLVSRILGALFH